MRAGLERYMWSVNVCVCVRGRVREIGKEREKRERELYVLGDQEVTANLYCNFAYLYWEGCVICSIYLR